MKNVARVSRQWVVRMLIAGIAFFGFGLWAVYDGFIYYPRRNHIIERFEEHREAGRMGEWRELAEQKGWPEEPDPDNYKTQWDIRTQFIMAAICLPLGLVILLRLGLKSRQSMATDEQHFIATNGRRIPYSAIVSLDKRRWDSKGIAEVYYENEQGRRRKTRVDTWIFKGGDGILRDIESSTGLGGAADESEQSGSKDDSEADD